MITKKQFVNLITALNTQYIKDVNNRNQLSAVLECDCALYDNSILSNAIIGLLRDSFPIVDNHCEIEFYCYYQNFGRIETENEVIVETAEELYERLLKEYGNIAYLVEALD